MFVSLSSLDNISVTAALNGNMFRNRLNIILVQSILEYNQQLSEPGFFNGLNQDVKNKHNIIFTSFSVQNMVFS